jgi:signal peptidase I
VFRRPPAETNTDIEDLIKRVIGLPGDAIEARNGTVLINGQPLAEPYVNPVCNGTSDFGPVAVPAGQLFVMGDNRCGSRDSRMFGTIDQDLVRGRAFAKFFPFDRVGWL